uniref:Leucine-rich repeat-containing N-terminal plant-type domain-containing protein n=1 Tax=Setaria italica TaxID=4555 RepID=K3ZAU7_SETIT
MTCVHNAAARAALLLTLTQAGQSLGEQRQQDSSGFAGSWCNSARETESGYCECSLWSENCLPFVITVIDLLLARWRHHGMELSCTSVWAGPQDTQARRRQHQEKRHRTYSKQELVLSSS